MSRIITLLLIFVPSLLSGPLLSAQTKSPSSFTTLASKADSARDAERLDEAVTLYRKALALRPSWAEGWWSLGTIQYDRSVYDEAARAFQKVTLLTPKNGTAFAMLGLCEFELGHDDLALKHIQKGADIGLHDDQSLRQAVLYHQGILLQRKGNFQAAQETLEDLCLRGGQGDGIANVLGMTLLRMDSKNPPLPGSADAEVVLRVGRGECLAGQKKYDEARPVFDAVVKENPSYPDIHYAYGLFLMELPDVAGAVEQFKQEVANNPKHVLARLRIAACLYKEDSAAGIAAAEEALRLEPGLPFGHYLLGLLLLDTDKSDRAIPELEIAQKAYSRDPKLYAALGSAYSRVGRKQDAARARATFERLNKQGENSKTPGEAVRGGTAGIPIDPVPPQH